MTVPLAPARNDVARVRTTSISIYVGRYLRWLGVALAISATPSVAFAHAHLVKSAPAVGAHLSVSPTLIQLWFSEAAEATMTTITVMGANGTQFRIGTVSVDASDPLLLVASVGLAGPSLTAGKYTVTWRTVAKDDGHPSQGTFRFVVDSNAATVATAPAVTGMTTVPRDSARVADVTIRAMDLEAPSIIFARWLNFLAIIIVVGVVAFRMLVIPGVVQNGSEHLASFANRASVRAAVVGLIAGVTTIIAAVGRLYAQQAVIGQGVSIATILDSSWGHVWLLQIVIAVIACIAFAVARSSHGPDRDNRAWIVAMAAALLLGATPSLSGHAIAAPEHRNISVALDMLHVIAAGGWLGGLLAVAVVGVPVALATGSDEEAVGSMSLIASVVNAFSPIALTFAATVVASGAVAAWLRVGSFAQLFHSTYGTVLLIKLGIVVLVLAGGAFNWLRMRGALSHHDSASSTIGAFRRSAWLELAAGVLVIAATAVLVAAQPPIH